MMKVDGKVLENVFGPLSVKITQEFWQPIFFGRLLESFLFFYENISCSYTMSNESNENHWKVGNLISEL